MVDHHGRERTESDGRAAHHVPGGGFRNPWPTAAATERERGGFLRWQRERRSGELPPNPPPTALPRVPSEIAYPRAPADELRITWIGHSTLLLQVGGANMLTDPIWSRRASPVAWAGPVRFVAPGVDFDRLPPLDAVLLSHDHYDHLDDRTVRRIHDTFGDRLAWFAPLGYRSWLARRGIGNLTELDWWDEAGLEVDEGIVRVTALPAQHWTRRRPIVRENRLWASWALAAPSGRSVYFAGDTGYFPGFAEIGERAGPFDAALLPIGAYEPRWFMRSSHMNPEEAVRAFGELGGAGTFVGMHWGTFRLTDEDPLEPPERTRAAWRRAGRAEKSLWIPKHGETRVVAGTEVVGSDGRRVAR